MEFITVLTTAEHWPLSHMNCLHLQTFVLNIHHDINISSAPTLLKLFPVHVFRLQFRTFSPTCDLLAACAVHRSWFVTANVEFRDVWKGLMLAFRRRARSQNRGKRLLASSCPSVRMELLGSHWTDFYEIRYLSSFVPKICRENSSFVNMWRITGTFFF
jgi:hypothetical protein